jgi:hypothetical protein
MISIGLSNANETTTRVVRATQRAATPRENGAQTGISSVHNPETSLTACVLQFLAVYVPVLVLEYLLLYICMLGH